MPFATEGGGRCFRHYVQYFCEIPALKVLIPRDADVNGGQGRNRTTDTRIFSPQWKSRQRVEHVEFC
jgi:hypothetical protein